MTPKKKKGKAENKTGPQNKPTERLIGIRETVVEWPDTGRIERTTAEWRLDPADSSNVMAVSGQETDRVQDMIKHGVSISDGDGLLAVDLGKRYGIRMPMKGRRYTIHDGARFLIAIMTYYKGSAYSGVYAITR